MWTARLKLSIHSLNDAGNSSAINQQIVLNAAIRTFEIYFHAARTKSVGLFNKFQAELLKIIAV